MDIRSEFIGGFIQGITITKCYKCVNATEITVLARGKDNMYSLYTYKMRTLFLYHLRTLQIRYRSFNKILRVFIYSHEILCCALNLT
jgi:hypothetical protein